MRICAIDLKSNEANLCLLELDQGLMNVPDCRAKKLTLINPSDTQAMRDYQRQFAKLIEDYKIEKLVIRERPMNGKFAGSAASFKIEAALQLLSIDCEIISAKAIKDAIKNQPILVSIKELGLKQFQEQAFTTGYAYLNR